MAATKKKPKAVDLANADLSTRTARLLQLLDKQIDVADQLLDQMLAAGANEDAAIRASSVDAANKSLQGAAKLVVTLRAEQQRIKEERRAALEAEVARKQAAAEPLTEAEATVAAEQETIYYIDEWPDDDDTPVKEESPMGMPLEI